MSPIVSARSVRPPIVTRRHADAATSISSAVHPPSGPTSTVAAFGGSTSSSENVTAAPVAPGSTSISAGPASHLSRRNAMNASKVTGSRIGGTMALPHCLAAEIATRSQRSWRRPFSRIAAVVSVLAVRIGRIAAAPIMTASRTTSSILSPLSTAWASVT